MLLSGNTKTCHFNHGDACGRDGRKLFHYHFSGILLQCVKKKKKALQLHKWKDAGGKKTV